VIIGAGAAGLAAAQELRGRHLAVLVLEARNRIGGRALTRHLDGGIVFDIGCEWLHSADLNPFVQIGRSLGFEVMPGQPHWTEQSFDINFPEVEQRQFRAASAAFHAPCAPQKLPWIQPPSGWSRAPDGTR
jgi:monoamine oxidase